MYTCADPLRVIPSLSSLTKLSCGDPQSHHSYLRVLGIQARLDLIAVITLLFALICNITKFWPFSLYQPSVVVDLHLLSGLRTRGTQSPDLLSRRPRHFFSIRGFILSYDSKIDSATHSPGRSTHECTHVNIVVLSTPRCAILVNIYIANTPNGVRITYYGYGYAHARHDAGC